MSERRGIRFWITATSLSGIGSFIAVRLATPTVLDEKLPVVLMFYVVPGLVLWALGVVKQAIGLLLAVFIPFLWLVISKHPSDNALLFLAPLIPCALIVFIALRTRGRALSPAIPIAAILAAAVTLLWPAPGRHGAGTRLLLIGLDGSTWNLIDPLVSGGKMPNFARLLQNGHRAKLRSLDSMFSPQVWTTIATGSTPQAHGIIGFASRSSDMRVLAIWDQLRMEGRSFGLCDWYFTWPPEPGQEDTDFIIPSVLAPDSLTHPPEYSFYRRLKEFEGRREKRGIRGGISAYMSAGLGGWRYGVRLSTLRRAFAEFAARRMGYREPQDAYWRARRLSIAVEGDLFTELIRTRSPEFAAVLFTDLDKVSHQYWKYMEPELFPEVTEAEAALYGNAIREMYMEFDLALGRILEAAPEDADVMIVSDHGFRAVTREEALKHRRVRILRVVHELGLEGRLLGANVGDYAYIYPMACPADEREKILEYAELMLRSAHYADTGVPLFTVEREDVALRLRINQEPEVNEDARIVLGEEDYPVGRFVSDPTRRDSGDHDPDGIYLFCGPSAHRASGADSLHVLDIAPTIAALLDLPMYPMWPGKPALQGYPRLYTRVADYSRADRTEAPPIEIDESLLEKLRALGYLE